MKWFLRVSVAVLFSLLLAGLAGADAPRKFKTGARRSPQHKIIAAPRFQAVKAAPAQAAWVPQKLDMWGNDQYGDCVTAEEAFSKACYQPEIFIDSATVVAWAQARGYRDGADLASVLQSMQSDGFVVGQQKYNDGVPQTVDYTTEATLQAAVAQGPVKIGIDSSALPAGAGSQQGWYAVGGGNFTNTDHCVSVCGYGPAEWLYQQLGVALPAALAGKSGYLVYTWSTIGFVDFAWLQGTCVEAWVRNPTTVGVPPLPPPPPPPPPPSGNPILTGVTATFSDGSTQSLGSAPAPTGLTPAQFRAMTGQQFQDWLNSTGKPKPVTPPKPAPPTMPPAKPISAPDPIVRALEGLEQRLVDRIDKRLDSIENRVRKLEDRSISAPPRIQQGSLLEVYRLAVQRGDNVGALDIIRIAAMRGEDTSSASWKAAGQPARIATPPVSPADTRFVPGGKDTSFKVSLRQGKGVMRSDSVQQVRRRSSPGGMPEVSVAQGTAEESYAGAYRRALAENKPLLVWVGGEFCPS